MVDKNSNLYGLNLGEIACIGCIEFIRVPGGWVMITRPEAGGVFIPFNDEFRPKDRQPPPTTGTRRGGDEMQKLTDKMPEIGENKRVLIYTAGVDFNGEQFFDVEADSLHEGFYENFEDMPEICRAATHWMELPYPYPFYFKCSEPDCELEIVRFPYQKGEKCFQCEYKDNKIGE